VENGGVFDTPPIDFTDGDLTIRCGEGPDGRRWYDTSPQGYGEDFETQPTKGGVKCASGEPEINGRTSSTYTPSNPYTFTRLGNVDISYGRDFECNLDLAVDPEDYDPPSSDSDYVYLGAGRTFLPESSFIRGDPEHPEIYREVSKESEYKLKVLAPLESILSTSASVSPTQVYPGDSFTITVNIENEVDFDIDLGDYDVTGDIVGGVPICQFILTPGTVGAGADVDVLLTCTVPPTAAPQTISGIQVSFTTDIQHPCSDDGTLTVPVPPVTVLRPLPSCTNGLDDDGDGKIDCLDEDCCLFALCPSRTNEAANDKLCCANGLDDDRDGLVDAADPQCFFEPEICDDGIDNDLDGFVDCWDPDCCNDTAACPIYLTDEGANAGTCCANLRDDDSDASVDCLDDSCCMAATECPMYSINEGANGRICCSNLLDEDVDGAIDMADPDCQLFENCSNGIDDDLDGAVDCNDTDCCMDAACPMYAVNEGANNMLCCNNTLDDDMDTLIDVADPDCQAGILCSVYSDWYNAVGAPDNPCITEPYDFLDNGFIDPRTVCVRDDDGDGLFDQQCDKNQAPPIVVPIG